ncbi:hypothetical protein GCM10010203_55290 [Actinomadura yumaensis]
MTGRATPKAASGRQGPEKAASTALERRGAAAAVMRRVRDSPDESGRRKIAGLDAGAESDSGGRPSARLLLRAA